MGLTSVLPHSIQVIRQISRKQVAMRSVRLHLNKNDENSTPFSATTESEPSSWTDGEPSAPPLPLSIALRSLMAEAEALHDRVDFSSFVNIAESPQVPFFRDSLAQWKRVERSSSFSLLKRDDEVLALARLDASVEEAVSILGATTDHLHGATMRGLYGDAFIAGSVAYVERPHTIFGEDDKVLAVKTSSFVRSDILGKNEQWCFGETLRSKPEGSITITQGSLTAHESQSLPARLALKDKKRRVAQLRDVSTAYLVERTTDSQSLRITFHALYKPGSSSAKDGDNAPVVARRAARARLLRLARGTSELSQLVRRRRFGTQVFADRSAFDARNLRCTCCTRKFTPFTKRSRCYLCGYNVCVTCSSSEKMETHNGRVASIIVCTRCVKSVVACNYDHMLTVRPGPERALSDEMSTPPSPCTVSTSSTVTSDFSASSSSQKLGELLSHVVCDDSDQFTLNQRRAAFLVLEQLLLIDQEEAQAQADKNAKLLKAVTEHHDPTEAAKRAVDISKCPKDPEACQFASANSRPYAMLPAIVQLEDDSNTQSEPIIYPIPTNEDERLAAIEHFHLHDIVDVPELNVICTMAAAEMDCPHSVLTLVERDIVTLLATNAPENWDVGSGNPREQTFCQHFVMDDKPLLVRHAEADMRFYHIAPVVLRGLRFYAGFPVSVATVSKTSGQLERVVVGALCCLDEKPHEMTRSQYWRLIKLADAASTILERTAKEYIADPKNHPLGQNGVGVRGSKSNGMAAVAC